MKVDTRFDIGQEVFWHNIREEKVEVSIVDEIRVDIWKGIKGVTNSVIYRLLPQQCWTSDYHIFANEDSAVAELEKWKRLCKKR